MTKRWLGILICVWLLPFNPIEGTAYELRTHERLTASAFEASRAMRTYLDDVGSNPDDIFDFDNRTTEDKLARFTNSGKLRDWMIEGAIREDDYQSPHPLLVPLLNLLGCDLARNPPSQIDRPIRHFLDVQRGGRGLTVGPFRATPATDWALGQQERGADPTQNQFSILDARVYQLRSLTEPEGQDRDRNTALLFRTLGQVIHTLQDMAQPQHTRNDSHTGCIQIIAGEHSWYEDYLERRALGHRFRQRAGQPFPLPLAGYAPPRFTSYRDFFTEPGQRGLADFSSRNFFSAGTNLSLFETCGGLPEPPCRRDAYVQRDTPFSFTAAGGTSVAGTVALFLRTFQDPVTGDVIPDVAVSSRSLWDQHLERRGFFPVFTLNSLNYDSISDVLLPRAVGYSAGFLDYFFRGRLDVDLVEDPVDPSLVRVEGRNAAPDSLDGTLTLYGDHPQTGLRQPLASTAQDLTVTAAPEAILRSAPFQAPPDIERFLAVYQGQLGGEMPGESFPGAVIGKALGGVRVEQVFFDFEANMWKLRTPTGVFVLKPLGRATPLTQADFEELRWGDGDRLVGRSPIGRGLPNQVVAWKVQRDQQSPLGLATEESPDGTVVRLSEQARASLANAPSLETSVSVSHTINYRQEMVATDWTNRLVWNPVTFFYDNEITVTSTVVTMANESVDFSATLPIVLDLDHYIGMSEAPVTSPSYAWFLQDVAVNTAGHLVGVVGVLLVGPRDNLVQRPALCREGPGPGTLRSELVNIGQAFPHLGEVVIWAVVDLTAGLVLASTAGSTISIASRSTVQTEWTPFTSGPPPRQAFHVTNTWSGGPAHGRIEEATVCSPMTGPLPESADLPSGFEVYAEHTVSVQDEHGLEVQGAVRGDLQAALGGLNRNSHTALPVASKWFGGGVVVHAAGATRSLIRKDPTVSSPLRARDGSDRLVLVANGRANDQGTDMLAVWDPGAARAHVPFAVPNISPETGGELSVTATTGSAALVSAFAHGGSYLLSLDGAFGPRFFSDPDGRLYSFTLLDPQFLYDTQTLRFFKLQPPLQATALPARLAPAAGNPFGHFHAIRLP